MALDLHAEDPSASIVTRYQRHRVRLKVLAAQREIAFIEKRRARLASELGRLLAEVERLKAEGWA
jgi:hypothetical protein